MLHSDMKIDDILKIKDQCPDHDTVFIHSGFTDPKKLSSMIDEGMSCVSNTFIEEHAKLLYRKHFNGHKRILLRDGFKRQRNADYPTLEEFSDLHVTYKELGMDGFGDFLTVGNAYSESGGPAYAVALHITFIDPSKDDVMYIYHFVSDTRDTPTDPAGKFSQALGKLIKKLNSNSSHIIETEAIKEFRLLHENGHFPGLGYIKKLSMKHHIETISVYLKASR